MRLFFKALLVVGLILGGGFWRFMDEMPRRAPDLLQDADGIAVLTGGAGRLGVGMDLLAQGRGERLLVSGVGPDVTKRDLIARLPAYEVWFECCVDLGTAPNTLANGHESAQWARAQNYESLILVTAAFHVPRALVELRRHNPDLTVLVYPVLTDRIKLDEWWRWPGTAGLLLEEYGKYLAALVRARLQTGMEP